MSEFSQHYGVEVVVRVEPEPLGTGGGVGFSKDLLATGEPFFCLNSDITCDFPFEQMLQFHRENGAEATMLVTRVDEPSKYGVVVTGPSGQVQHFVEKPATFVSSFINAGIYLFSPSVLARIEPKPMSLERDVFPALAKEGLLFAMPIRGFWMDIGQPKDYLTGTSLFLDALAKRDEGALYRGRNVTGRCLVHPTATVSDEAFLGPDVVVGPNCTVRAGAHIAHSVMLESSEVHEHARVSRSIIGWKSILRRWAHVANGSVLGEDVTVGEGCALNGAIVLPHKQVERSVWSHEIIM
jgi:mannose-1-phosphate guanylyltransferase